MNNMKKHSDSAVRDRLSTKLEAGVPKDDGVEGENLKKTLQVSSSLCASPMSLFRPISELITLKSTLAGDSNNELETGDSHKDLL